MFTGIIEGFGTIKTISGAGEGKKMQIESDFELDDTKIGDSIAVNGACLTAVKVSGRVFEVDVSPETMDKSTFPQSKPGDRVNLERALKVSGRLDGHIVSGHIDGTGTISSVEEKGNAIIIRINAPENIMKYIIEKGSVAVDGTSLTINSWGEGFFSLAVIPHTRNLSTIGSKKVGERVNLESDVIGKYIEKLITGKTAHSENNGGLSIDFLKNNGFL
ncbi:MAG: riboflavin synthase [Deltaproteobacteria bacterium]|nr:MAG: riboflavin synthase [Deltaproteobacteria bacterium]